MKYKANFKVVLLAAAVLLIAAGCNKAAQNNTENQNQNATQQTQENQSSDSQNQNNNQQAANNTPANTTNQKPVPEPGGTLAGDLHFSGESDAMDQSPEVLEVQITKDGFTPSTITVHAGDYVQFVNKDTVAHRPASDPHPTHTDLPGFDSKNPLQPGDKYRFQFTKVGTWGYHDHLNPTTHGEVIVK